MTINLAIAEIDRMVRERGLWAIYGTDWDETVIYLYRDAPLDFLPASHGGYPIRQVPMSTVIFRQFEEHRG